MLISLLRRRLEQLLWLRGGRVVEDLAPIVSIQVSVISGLLVLKHPLQLRAHADIFLREHLAEPFR